MCVYQTHKELVRMSKQKILLASSLILMVLFLIGTNNAFSTFSPASGFVCTGQQSLTDNAAWEVNCTMAYNGLIPENPDSGGDVVLNVSLGTWNGASNTLSSVIDDGIFTAPAYCGVGDPNPGGYGWCITFTIDDPRLNIPNLGFVAIACGNAAGSNYLCNYTSSNILTPIPGLYNPPSYCGSPITDACARFITTNSYEASVQISSPSSNDISIGQSVSFTANVLDTLPINEPYTYALNVVNSITNVIVSTNTISSVSANSAIIFYTANALGEANSPLKANVVVTDAESIIFNSTYSSEFTINGPYIAQPYPPLQVITKGQTAEITDAGMNGGTPPYTYQWYASSTSPIPPTFTSANAAEANALLGIGTIPGNAQSPNAIFATNQLTQYAGYVFILNGTDSASRSVNSTAATIDVYNSTLKTDSWAGYYVSSLANHDQGSSNAIVSGVNGSWIVQTAFPSLANNFYTIDLSAQWIGIGGVFRHNNTDIIQVGTYSDYLCLPIGCTPEYLMWYETLPSLPLPLPLLVSPGDKISAYIKLLPSESISQCANKSCTFNVTINDITKGEHDTFNVAYNSTLDSAEWVDELPTPISVHGYQLFQDNLTAFGNTSYGEDYTGVQNTNYVGNYTGGNNLYLKITGLPYANISMSPLAYTSPLSSDGTSFKVYGPQSPIVTLLGSITPPNDVIIDKLEAIILNGTYASNPGTYDYQWYNTTSGSDIPINSQNSPIFIFNALNTGTFKYNVAVTSPTNNLFYMQSENLTLTVNPPLTVNATSTTAIANPGNIITFNSVITGGSGNFVYQWYNVSSRFFEMPVANQISNTMSLTFNSVGNFSYELIVTDIGTTSSPNTIVASLPVSITVTNTVTLPSAIRAYLPITLLNYQNSAITPNTPIAIGISNTFTGNIIGFNAIEYQQYETCNLNNAEFFFKNGTVINSWLEGNLINEEAYNSICSSSSSANALSASANILYWIDYPWPSSFLPANSGTNPTTNTIYLGWTGNVISTTNTLLNGNTVGEAPQLSCGDPGTYANTMKCTDYGEYDNGNTIFKVYYNFIGTSTPSGLVTSGTYTQDNGIYIPSKKAATANTMTYYSPGTSNVFEGLIQYTGYPTAAGWGDFGAIAPGVSSCKKTTSGICWILTGEHAGVFQPEIGTVLGASVSPNTNWNIYSAYWPASTKGLFNFNYGATNTVIATASLSEPFGVSTASADTNALNMQWIRIRTAPPNDILPGTVIGNVI